MQIETFESLVNHTLVGHYNSYSYTQNFGKNPLKDCQKTPHISTNESQIAKALQQEIDIRRLKKEKRVVNSNYCQNITSKSNKMIKLCFP